MQKPFIQCKPGKRKLNRDDNSKNNNINKTHDIDDVMMCISNTIRSTVDQKSTDYLYKYVFNLNVLSESAVSVIGDGRLSTLLVQHDEELGFPKQF